MGGSAIGRQWPVIWVLIGEEALVLPWRWGWGGGVAWELGKDGRGDKGLGMAGEGVYDMERGIQVHHFGCGGGLVGLELECPGTLLDD